MGQRARIEDSTKCHTFFVQLAVCVDFVDQLAFMVALKAVGLKPECPSSLYAQRMNIIKRTGPVQLGFAGAQQVQIGAIEYKYFHDLSIRWGLQTRDFATVYKL